MIISEKQIMQLIAIARGYSESLAKRGKPDLSKDIRVLLDTITIQQSTELKEIK